MIGMLHTSVCTYLRLVYRLQCTSTASGAVMQRISVRCTLEG